MRRAGVGIAKNPLRECQVDTPRLTFGWHGLSCLESPVRTISSARSTLSAYSFNASAAGSVTGSRPNGLADAR